MPPVDSSTPTPPPADGPTPEPPKPEKIGFFAKLFGKKPKESTAQANPESQTSLAQPGDSSATNVAPIADQSVSADQPAAVTDVPVATEVPSMPESNPSGEEEEKPPTLDVPPSVNSEEPKVDEGMAVPPVVADTSSSEESDEKPTEQSVPRL